MSELVIAEKSDLVSIADEIRAIVGNTGKMSLDKIKSNLVNIAENMLDVFHTTITPVTSGEVVKIELSEEYKLPIAVIIRVSPENNITGSLQYPSRACYVVFTGKEFSSSNQMNFYQQVNNYWSRNSINNSRDNCAWYDSTSPRWVIAIILLFLCMAL